MPEKLDLNAPLVEPFVSIIIPTRNEGRNIGRLLDSLLNLEYRNYEIIVVDGNSTDNTKEIVNSYEKVYLVNEEPRPETWIGKPWGCFTGYNHAKGEILLFTDADTYHHPKSLAATVERLDTTRGFLSLVTTQEFLSFWEHMLTIVFLIISISVRGTKGTKRSHIANGQYMMFKRSTYEELGTHKVVAGSIIEDLAFGTYASKKGIPPLIPISHNLVTTRMYRSLKEIQEGFGKNLALGVGQSGIDSVISSGFITAWGLGWVILLLVALISGSLDSISVIIILLGYLSFSLMLYYLESKLSTNGTFYVLFYPVYFVVFHIIVVYSIFKTFIRKEIIWKDQTYSV